MNSNKRGGAPSGRGRVRIVGGEYRSRLIGVPARPGLRPTPDRVRQTLFNWLGQDLEGMACLDLYAGSGALGFEAASRGAARAGMVAKDRATLAGLRASREKLGAVPVDIVAGDALAFLDAARERFDVVFLDPPFGQNLLPELLGRLPRVLAPEARVYAEARVPAEARGGWVELKRGKTGQVSYQLLRWSANDQSGVSGNV